MKKVFCDKHPDREAVATFKVKELPVGSRPIVIGTEYSLGFPVIDLCEECAELVRPLPPSKS